MANYITAIKFCKLHDLSIDTVYAYAHNHKNCKHITKNGSTIMYDNDYFEGKQREIKKLWLACHDYYYYITEKLSLSTLALARLIYADYPEHSLDSWYQYLVDGLWNRVDTVSILRIQSGYGKLYKLTEWFEYIIPTLDRRRKK